MRVNWPGRRRQELLGRTSVRREVAQFVAALLVVTVLIGVAALVAVRRNAEAEAESTAQAITQHDAISLVEPSLSDGLLTGDQAALSSLDRLVRNYVLDQRTLRVKIWSADGRILYSDEPRLVGERYPLEADELDALRSRSSVASVSDLSKPENRFERGEGSLLEVYQGVQMPNSTRLLFETYQPVTAVAADEQRIWSSFLPLLLGGLVLLLLAEVPLAWRLASRLDRARQEREALYARSIGASVAERRRIAADLHDSVVQDVASTKLRLSMAAERLRRRLVATVVGAGGTATATVAPSADDATVEVLETSAADLGRASRELRTLIVELAPRKLSDARFADVLDDLCAPLRERGVSVQLEVSPDPQLRDGEAALVFRVAQELLRNVSAHAQATHVTVTFQVDAASIALDVVDDGRGIDPAVREERRREGHMGLSLLEATVHDARGSLQLSSIVGEGTHAQLRLRRRP
jgi:signal transduction histidine kinase